jgi:Domain of unknown function (DUF305)
MIPHHAGAILMCGEASIRDAEINELCKTIISSQQSEIDQMKTILIDSTTSKKIARVDYFRGVNVTTTAGRIAAW